MGKWVAGQVLDGALAVVAQADLMLAVSGQPVDFQQAFNGRLAAAALTAGDFTLGAGEVSGRRIGVAAKAAIPVFTAGTADHVALVHSATNRLLYVTTCTAQSLSAGGTVSFDGWTVEIGAPD